MNIFLNIFKKFSDLNIQVNMVTVDVKSDMSRDRQIAGCGIDVGRIFIFS